MSTTPEVRYARSGELRIAYRQFGEGDIDLLIAPGFISNLDMMWEIPPFQHMLERLGTFARCLVFDKRGTGLSDRELGIGSLEERMDDLRAVLDDAGIERAAVYGYSEGGPLSILFAAAHPERVSALALYGTMARVEEAPDYPDGLPRELLDAAIAHLEESWGRGTGLQFFISHAPDNDATKSLVGRYERGAASPAMARQILQLNTEIDVRALLPTVIQPTLVLHTIGDPVARVSWGRFLAEHIQGARYIEHEGDFHMTWNAEEIWWVDEVESFLTGHRPSPVQPDRFLATVLFTDIVGSTEEANRHGDRAWRGILDNHDRLASAEVARHGGRVVKTTGDGLLAVLDSPSRAVACAAAVRDAIGPLGIRMRAGVHTGEIEGRGDDVGGLGVHIASRIADLATPGEVWVSRTVRDLTAGSGLVFAEQGQHQLKGVPDSWDLYAVRG